MTAKQEKILESALELFAEKGYHATSTSKVAKQAKVSEGLIFRHFGSKAGLLNAVLEEGEKQIRQLYADIVLETEPRVVIRKTLLLPFAVPESDYPFWRLLFKLKWEMPERSGDKMEPLALALVHAFKKLYYPQAEQEAAFLLFYLDGISTALLRGEVQDKEALKAFLLGKYEV